MKNLPKLIVMLTHDDFTVPNAAEIFEQCRNSQADFWGFKEHPLPKKNMEELYARMKECGKTTFLEVVAYTESEGLEGAKMAADCGCDILMGTIFYYSINEFCQQHQLKYMPFVGVVEGRPSVLSGDMLRTELRSTKEFPYAYRIVEEGHHFHKEENGEYYRISKIYRECILKATGEVVKKELKWNNHSKVMFDHALIPQEQIR